MIDKFHNRYRIESTRLQNWDYGWNGAYFITICTQNREHYFGEIHEQKMKLSEIGKLVHDYWHEIPNHFQNISLGEFIVMPNHIHGIIIIDKPCGDNDNNNDDIVETRQCLVSTTTNTPNPYGSSNNSKTIGQKRFQNQGKNTLSSIVGSYKSVVTKNVRLIHANFAWQSRFHDHIIRDDKSFNTISNYIQNNPLKWGNDRFNGYR